MSALFILAGGIVIIVGTLMPWALIADAYQQQTRSGLEGPPDGPLFLLAGIWIALVGAAGLTSRLHPIALVLVALPVVLCWWGAHVDSVNMHNYIVNATYNSPGITADVGVGPGVVSFGGFIAACGVMGALGDSIRNRRGREPRRRQGSVAVGPPGTVGAFLPADASPPIARASVGRGQGGALDDSSADPSDAPMGTARSNLGPVTPAHVSPPTVGSTTATTSAKPGRRGWLIVAGVIALALIVGGVTWTLWPKTFTLNGFTQVNGSYATGKVGAACSGTGGASNVNEGADVTVYDSSGAIVAQGRLGPGVGKTDSRFPSGWSCEFPYSFEVPAGSKFYSVEIGHAGGKLNYTDEQMRHPINSYFG